MKRIVFVTGVMAVGGAERVIANLSNSFAKEGIAIRIISIFGDSQEFSLEDSIEVCPIVASSKLRLQRPFERIRKLRQLIKEFKPDCVISFLADVNIHTILACKNTDIPLIVSERNDPNYNPRVEWMRNMRNKLYKKTHGIVFQTQDAADYFIPYLKKEHSIKVIPNPITSGLPYHVFDKENIRLITVCRLDSQKNLKLMIDAVGSILDDGIECYLDIYGEGIQRQELEDYIEKKELTEKVCLKGFSFNVHQEVVRSAVFINSSDYEGISNSLLEALAIGIPVIATDCPIGGSRMFIRNGENGYLVPVRDLDALKEKIIYVLQNKEYAEELGKTAIKIRELLALDTITQTWKDYIDFVIAKVKNKRI